MNKGGWMGGEGVGGLNQADGAELKLKDDYTGRNKQRRLEERQTEPSCMCNGKQNTHLLQPEMPTKHFGSSFILTAL